MQRIELLDAALADLERIVEHDPPHAPTRTRDVLTAIDVLCSSPHIGRHVSGGKRELVVGRGTAGYIVLYRHVEPIETILILGIRAQREAGYRPA